MNAVVMHGAPTLRASSKTNVHLRRRRGDRNLLVTTAFGRNEAKPRRCGKWGNAVSCPIAGTTLLAESGQRDGTTRTCALDRRSRLLAPQRLGHGDDSSDGLLPVEIGISSLRERKMRYERRITTLLRGIASWIK